MMHGNYRQAMQPDAYMEVFMAYSSALGDPAEDWR
jgi:hypothetical protein